MAYLTLEAGFEVGNFEGFGVGKSVGLDDGLFEGLRVGSGSAGSVNGSVPVFESHSV